MANFISTIFLLFFCQTHSFGQSDQYEDTANYIIPHTQTWNSNSRQDTSHWDALPGEHSYGSLLLSYLCMLYLHNKQTPNPKFGCKANGDHQKHRIELAGMATSLTQDDGLAQPIITSDISKCQHVETPAGLPIDCCPPDNNQPIVDFKLPSHMEPLKIRPAAHLAGPEYIEKYKKAVELMKALPLDDPRNFLQQANVHCAYCDGAYDQLGHPNLTLQVHESWLFFPWHRCYLYFYERILGKLLGDETFAIPFWNWDAPEGMMIPSIYTDPSSSLYHSLRDASHQPPTVVDLNYDTEEEEPTIPTGQLIGANLKLMYRQVISGAKRPELFMGSPYRAGDQPYPGSGTLENAPHNTVHSWVGDPTQGPDRQDMGAFYSAARDPLFYAHHNNIDRLWNVWKKQGGRRRDFDDRDFLEASFLFYDENKRLVRIKVEDCLVSENLRYNFQDVENIWLGTPPTPSTTNRRSLLKLNKTNTNAIKFPVNLDSSPITTLIKRPKMSRSKGEKDEEEEVLVVDNIEFDGDAYIKFDVYINTIEYEQIGPESSEFAGSFVHLPHKHSSKMNMKVMKSKLNLGINDLLDDIEAEDDESLLVTLLPRRGKVKIGGLKIEFL